MVSNICIDRFMLIQKDAVFFLIFPSLFEKTIFTFFRCSKILHAELFFIEYFKKNYFFKQIIDMCI